MAGLSDTIAALMTGRHRFDPLYLGAMLSTSERRAAEDGVSETAEFGSNPGNLRMLSLVPADLAPGAPLVVVLHGCRQEAVDYARAAGWSTLARRHGFALLLPEQRRDNNTHGCFNWYQAGDIGRDRGEALSIRQMIEHMLVAHAVDRSRVYVTGLSAGGAMACALMAAHPEVFAGGAIIAGLPYRCARNVQRALAVMARPSARSERVWGFLVRSASTHHGPWPSISIWHGSNDRIVAPANALALAAQWRNVHGIAENAAGVGRLHGHAHHVWRDADGRAAVEMILVEGMGHGTPVDAAGATDEQLGEPDRFVLDVGIASTLHLARQWRLAPGLSPSSGDALADTIVAPAPDRPPAAARRTVAATACLDRLGHFARLALRRLAGRRRVSQALSADWEGEWEVRAAVSGRPEAGPMFVGHARSSLSSPGGRQGRVLRRKLTVAGQQRLTYECQLDLRAPANLFATASFQVLVDDVVVDRAACADRRDLAWTRKVIDLDRFAGHEVELRFEVSAHSSVMIEAKARAALRGIAIESLRGAAFRQRRPSTFERPR